MLMPVRIVFSGGGTGGHVYPAIAVADALKGRIGGLDLIFIGTRTGLEATAVPAASYDIRFIRSRGLRGRGPVSKLCTLASISVGVVQALAIVGAFRPDLVFGSGGYASAAVVIASSLARRTIVLQEQNSIPGMTNRLLAPRAVRVYLGFEQARERFGRHRGILVTGNPLRRSVLADPGGEPRRHFGLGENLPVLLVFGGSQGSSSLNRAAVDFFLRVDRAQGILQTGKRDFEWVRKRLGGVGGRVYVSPFIDDIHIAYRAADVALARSGALSVSELAAVGLPSILVPYPHAADDHQVSNARFLLEHGGAVMIEDRALSGEALAEAFRGLAGDPARLARMRAALGAVARGGGSRRPPGGGGHGGGGIRRCMRRSSTCTSWASGGSE
jgi:UDP-N-acetylglucosamine--N-acetylmuramyl-(pentapeptide) pyrophosphoryl-undecaprenol N-acetylglucosamine transferase